MPASSVTLVLLQKRQERESREFRQDLLAAQDTQKQLRQMSQRLRQAAELYRERLEGTAVDPNRSR